MAKTIRYSRDGVCIIDGCDKKRHAKGLCRMHYARVERHGDPHHRQRHNRIAECQKGIDAEPGDCVLISFQEGRRPQIQLGGITTNASRYVWTQVNGDPGDLWVLHDCGNGDIGCVNIHHLYLGTPQDNSDDRTRHGATPQGSSVKGSKLTESDVRDIRDRFVIGRIDRGGNGTVLAEEYGVSYMTIWKIATHRAWKHT